MVMPPADEMTDEELGRSEFALVNGTGFSYSLAGAPTDAPLVEAKRTHEDVIPRGAVAAELRWAQNGEGSGRSSSA
jgi:hypothetical protein